MLRLVKKKYFSKEISIDRFLNFSIKTLILIFIEEALKMGIQIALMLFIESTLLAHLQLKCTIINYEKGMLN